MSKFVKIILPILFIILSTLFVLTIINKFIQEKNANFVKRGNIVDVVNKRIFKGEIRG